MFRFRRNLRREFEQEALPHLDALYGAARKLTYDEHDAQDLVQETMLRAYKFFHQYQPGTNVRAWLFRVLYTTFVNGYRSRVRQSRFFEDAERADHYELVAGEQVGVTTLPDEVVHWRLIEEDVRRALGLVPPEFRMAVILCDIEGFTYKEIAEILDCPVGTVMSRIYRGRRILQRLLRSHAAEAGIACNEEEQGESGQVVSLMGRLRERNRQERG